MQKANSNKGQKVSTKANKGDKIMQKQTKAQNKELQVRIEDTIYQALTEANSKDNNIRVQKVTGYVSVKYGNKVLFEFHDKKKSISHLTFAKTQRAYEILKANKLIQRVVPKSYGWKYDTECLLTTEFIKHFPAILKSVIAEAIEERNLQDKAKKQTKEPVKKVAKA